MSTEQDIRTGISFDEYLEIGEKLRKTKKLAPVKRPKKAPSEEKEAKPPRPLTEKMLDKNHTRVVQVFESLMDDYYKGTRDYILDVTEYNPERYTGAKKVKWPSTPKSSLKLAAIEKDGEWQVVPIATREPEGNGYTDFVESIVRESNYKDLADDLLETYSSGRELDMGYRPKAPRKTSTSMGSEGAKRKSSAKKATAKKASVAKKTTAKKTSVAKKTTSKKASASESSASKKASAAEASESGAGSDDETEGTSKKRKRSTSASGSSSASGSGSPRLPKVVELAKYASARVVPRVQGLPKGGSAKASILPK